MGKYSICDTFSEIQMLTGVKATSKGEIESDSVNVLTLSTSRKYPHGQEQTACPSPRSKQS